MLKKIIPGVLSLLMLCSCSFFSDRSDESENFEFDTFENVKEGFDDIYTLQLKNVKLAEGMKINKPEKLIGMHIEHPKVNAEKVDELADHFFPDDKLCTTDIKSRSDYYIRETFSNGGQFIYSGYGYFSMAFSEADMQPIWDHTGKAFLNSKYDDAELSLKDGRLKMSRAVELAKVLVNEYTDILEIEEYIPTIVNYNKFGFDIKFSPTFGGWQLPEQSTDYDYNAENGEMLRNNMGSQVRCCVASSKRAGLINDMGYMTSKEIKKYDKMITLASALEYLDKELAPYINSEIMQISLVQLNTARTTEKDESMINENTSDTVIEQYAGYDTSPAYQFNIITSRGEEFIIYIDCITGETALGRLMSGE